MQNTFNERLLLIKSHLGCKSDRGFAKQLGIKYSKLQTYFKGSNPGIDVLDIIMSNQEWINSDWLITGRGDMIKKDDTSCARCKELEQKLYEANITINYLRKLDQKENSSIKEGEPFERKDKQRAAQSQINC
jgi:hypothetical protein